MVLSVTAIQNMFLGIACGDAIGAGLENQDAALIQNSLTWGEYQSIKLTDEERAGCALGRYTDDAEHSLAVAKLVTDYNNGTITNPDADTFIGYFNAEYTGFKVKHGFGRGGHGSFGKYAEGEKTLTEVRDSQRSRVHPGNAPPMRALAIGLLPAEEIDAFSRWNADSTHPHPEGIAASAAIAWAAHYMMIEDINPADIFKKIIPHITDDFTRNLFLEVDQLSWPLAEADQEKLLGPQPVEHYLKKYSMRGLPCEAGRTAAAALYIVKHARSVSEGIKASLYLGGDVDSVAAIVGGLVAARFGIDDLPRSYLDELEDRDYVLEVAKKLALAVGAVEI